VLIDNSAANEFRTCPLLYFENREAEGTGLEPKSQVNEVTPLALGSRIHENLEEYYQELKGTPIALYPESPNGALENEAQIIMTAYKAKYPMEDFHVRDVERTFKVQLPAYCPHCYTKYNGPLIENFVFNAHCQSCNKGFPARFHIYTGKIDVVFRDRDGILNIMDHKSEKRQSRSNHPMKWAARDQASLYLWAASKIYPGEEIGNFYVNILKRPSEKLQEGPIFPDRQRLERTAEQIEIAVRDLVFIADEIERYKAIFKDQLWPSNREECSQGFYNCDYYLPHTFGWDPIIREQKFQVKTPYLQLEGIEVLRP